MSPLSRRRGAVVAGGLALGAATLLVLSLRHQAVGASESVPTPPSALASAPAPRALAPGERVIPVTTFVALRKDVPVILEGLGTVTPLATVTVKTLVDGRLDRVFFTEGQRVAKGELIALVDPRPFTIQLHTAEAALARDDAQLRNGKLNLGRYDALRKQDLIPQQQVDDQRATVEQLDAATRADKAQIETARLMLDYAHIKSPLDGVTGVRQVDPGNIVHPADATSIVVITQIDPIAVLFTLPQDDLPRIQAAMNEGKLPVDAFARDGVRKLGSGALLMIDNQVAAQTATIRLKAILPNPDRAMWPNAFAKARMRLTTVRGALVVPASAVQRGPSGSLVYVVAPDQTATPRPVEVASVVGELALVAKGLSDGDVVVSDGQNQLRPGSRVAARPSASARPSP
jgi:membrane fusion protein, multidrug efflux system